MNNFAVEKSVSDSQFQMTKIVSSSLAIINLYRSNNARENFLKALEDLIDFGRTLIITGDFNYCNKSEQKHPVHCFFKERKFVQLVKEATHSEGRLLDHSYVFSIKPFIESDYEAKSFGCYYSDHDKVITSVKISNQGEEL